jgi:LemA protein
MGVSGGLLVFGGLALAGGYAWYVTLVTRRNKVREAMSSVDVHLTQRHDLVPSIVALARQYLQHERELLTEVTRLREAASQTGTSPRELGRRFDVERQLGQSVGQLFVRMEAYPELKAAGPLVEAQKTWIEVEAQITAARRFYNAAVNRLNNAAQMFPGSIIAALVGVQAMPFFEASATAREVPGVGDAGPRP